MQIPGFHPYRIWFVGLEVVPGICTFKKHRLKKKKQKDILGDSNAGGPTTVLSEMKETGNK